MLERLSALQREFPGIASNVSAFAVYVSTALFLILIELVRSLGVIFSGLTAYALIRYTGMFPRNLRTWWWIIGGIQGLPVFQFAFSNFFLADRYTVGLALTLLVAVPFCADGLWKRWRTSGRRVPWQGPALAVLLAVEAVDGMDVTTDKQYLKKAGLWLRQNVGKQDTIYSNSRILVYCSGLRETEDDLVHTWREAMTILWTDRWQKHDYFVLDMKESNSRNKVLLMKRIKSEPVKVFSNDSGDSALIFRAAGAEGH